ncbi:MAG: 4Fe-4S binding protein [Desulfobacteraceae bacterium]|nr:4Fe-4S binding protein [Desulfobacteraceae bacterium]
MNYEIFGVALNLTGATYLFAMTGLFFIVSIFIKRPWCNYLFPMTLLSDLLQLFTRSYNQAIKSRTKPHNI